MRFILGIDTAGPLGSVALGADGASRGMIALPPRGHSAGLAEAAARLTAAAGTSLASLAGIAVSQGPGSFTGLRVGLAWAKGVAVGAGVPLVLLSAHEAAAHEAATAEGAPAGDRLLLTLTPGERRQVEIALWSPSPLASPGRSGGLPTSLHEAESVPELDLAERIEAVVGGRTFLALPSNDAIAALLEEEGIAHRAPAPLARSIAALGAFRLERGEAADVALAAPAYGRAPNARKPTTAA